MGYQAAWSDHSGVGGPAVIRKSEMGAGPDAEVFHEGRHVRIRLNKAAADRVVMIPLRNGFPLHATDRAAQCFSVIDALGRRVAFAIKLPDYGLRLVFDRSPVAGDYLIRTQTRVGTA